MIALFIRSFGGMVWHGLDALGIATVLMVMIELDICIYNRKTHK